MITNTAWFRLAFAPFALAVSAFYARAACRIFRAKTFLDYPAARDNDRAKLALRIISQRKNPVVYWLNLALVAGISIAFAVLFVLQLAN